MFTVICKYLLKNGADLRLKDKHGQTSLHVAAELGILKICMLNVEDYKHIDINTKDNSGKTPIHFAVEHGKLETAKFLFSIGGDLNSRTNERDTPLHIAARYGHTRVVEFILANVVDKNPLDVNGYTPLYYATQMRYLGICKLLFDSGGTCKCYDRFLSQSRELGGFDIPTCKK